MVELVFESVADNQLTIPARPTARMCKKREKFAVFSNNKLMHPVISLICLRLRRVQVLVSVFCVVHYDVLVAARPQLKAGHDAVGQDQVQGDRKAF